MFQLVTLALGLVLSASCMTLNSLQIPTYIVRLDQPRYAEPNYNFAYEITDANTGDFKSQSESRKGDAVFGKYSFVQPDGIRRTVEYKADDKDGFIATINNQPNKEDSKNNSANEDKREKSSTSSNKIDTDLLKQFLDQHSQLNPVTQPTLTMPRSQVIQSVADSQEPRILTILHT